MENKSKVLRWFVCGAMLLAMISLLSPFAAVDRYHREASTGVEIIAMEDDDAGFLVLALLATVAGLLTVLVGIKQESRYMWPLILSVVSCSSVWLCFSEDMDYVTNGFWLFIIAHVISAVLCGMICANAKSSEEKTETTDKEQTNG